MNKSLILFAAILIALSGIGIAQPPTPEPIPPASSEGIDSSDWLAAGMALVAAFLGAYLAYLLAGRSDKIKLTEMRRDAGLRAQFALIVQYSTLVTFSRQLLEEFREDPERATKLRTLLLTEPKATVDLDALSFLLATKKADVVQQVYLAEQAFKSAIESNYFRNRQLEAVHAGDLVAVDMNSGHGRVSVDPKYVVVLKISTDEMYKAVDRAIPRLQAAEAELKKALLAAMPGQKFLSTEPAKPAEVPATAEAK